MDYHTRIQQHYELCWQAKGRVLSWQSGPVNALSTSFAVLEFRPTSQRDMWTYATVGLSADEENNPIELHLLSSIQDESLVELLTSIAYYHKTTTSLDLDHTVNFGRSWQKRSQCTYGFISLPYLDGPQLEDMEHSGRVVKCYWLIPVTKSEVDFKIASGVEALEAKFESVGFNYLDPYRSSVV